jgi:hypothetical protein
VVNRSKHAKMRNRQTAYLWGFTRGFLLKV